MAKKRAQKTSKGIHGGGGKVKLTRLEKFLMTRGGGPTGQVARKMRADSFKGKPTR